MMFLIVALTLTAPAIARAPIVNLAEPDRHAVGGETLVRTLVIDNPTSGAMKYQLKWQAMIESAVAGSGTVAIAAAPGETIRRELRLELPAVKRAVRMDLVVQPGPRELHRWRFKIYPARPSLDWRFMTGKRIGVAGRLGVWSDWLTSRGATAVPLSGVTDANEFDGDLVLIEAKAIGLSECAEYLSRWADRAGARPLILLAGSAPGPTVSAGRTPAGQQTDDLIGWKKDGVIGTALPAPAGSFRRLYVPDGGALGSLLYEIRGAGGALGYVCSMPLAEKLGIEPACEPIVRDMLAAAFAQRSGVSAGVALIVDPDADSMLLLKRAVFGSEDATAASLESNPGAAIVDATRDVSAEQFGAMKKYAQAGGTLIVLGLSSSSDFSRWALEGTELLEAGSDEDFIRESDQFKNLVTEQEWRALAGDRVAYRLPESTKYKESTSGVMRVRSEGNGRLILIQLDPGKMSVEQLRLILGQILFNMGVRVPSIEYRFNE